MRKIKFAAVALLTAFALTACNDEVIAKPTGYDDNSPVVEINGSSDIYNNNLKDIYDSIRDGNLASDVLDQLLYQYAVSIFGNYNEVTASKITGAKESFGQTTLKKAVAGLEHDGSGKLTGGNADTEAFINDHSAFWTKDKEGKRVEESKRGLTEFARLEEKWNSIEKRIAKKMYSLISGGSYSKENVFDEAKFVRSLSNSIENNVAANPVTFKGVLTSKVEDYEVFTKTTEKLNSTDEDYILHRENYQSNYKVDQEENKDQDATYVEDNLIPDIYRELLVEQYILDKSYDTLGRTSARHISVLSLSKNSKFEQAHAEVMERYVHDYVFDSAATPIEINLDSFKMVSNAWIGTFMNDANYASTEEYALMSSALDSDKYFVNSATPYFKGTAYGDMMQEIEKIQADPKVSENESTYTGGNTYTIEVGKEIKTRELDLKNNTFTGWYIKSSGVANLPETIKTKLFDINVANAFNGDPCIKYEFENGQWTVKGEDDKKTIKVVGEVNGKYFLRNTSRVSGAAVENDIIFEDGTTQYIVLVEDALRSKNLDKDVATTADQLEVLETYINETVQLVSNNDTYKNLSKKHWLKEMNLKYHDTVVYDYFKSNFPELFD